MSETNKAMNDEFPDRLSVDPDSPYYNADILARDVGIRFKGVAKTNVEEYCISEGWVRVTAGNAKDRYGNPLTIKVHVDAVAGRGEASDNGGNWLFGDIHWRHPVSATPYNLFQRTAGFDPGETGQGSTGRAPKDQTMIALAGAERLALGISDGLDAVARPRWPLDEARALSDPAHKAGRKGAKA